jgi:hypothetical protein
LPRFSGPAAEGALTPPSGQKLAGRSKSTTMRRMAGTSVTYFYMTGIYCTDRTQPAPQVSTSSSSSLSFSYAQKPQR